VTRERTASGPTTPETGAEVRPPDRASSNNHPELLYIHPAGHLNDRVVPTGAITSVNATGVRRLGRYAFEVADDEIRAARVIALDLHWNVSLPFYARLVAHVRRLAPATPIVVGGISAGHFAPDLLAQGLADHVVSGDSEPFFAALVERLVAGTDPRGLPNVRSADDPPGSKVARMSVADFNRLDPLTVDWFPSHRTAMCAPNWAFNAGPTISVVRGCTARCPDCYGSCARLFGGGTLSLTPQRLGALVRQAAADRAPSLRMLIGKPPAAYLTELFRELARSGPHAQDDVGLNLCTPPTDEAIDLLAKAFDGHVALSVMPPDEHRPAPSPERVARDTGEWIRVAKRFAGSDRLMLDLWTGTAESAAHWRERLAEAGIARPKVSQSWVWQMTRPTDGGPLTMADAMAAFEPFWTFPAARLLVPGLSRQLAPFRHLDEIVEDPTARDRQDGVWAPFWERALADWYRHRLPMLPGLSFVAVPVAGKVAFEPPEVAGIATTGDLAEVSANPGPLRPAAAPWPLEVRHDHAGTTISGHGDLAPDTGAVVLVPCLDGRPCVPLGAGDALPEGLAGLPVRGAGPARVTVRIELQTASIRLESPADLPSQGGTAAFARYRRTDNS